LRNILSNIPTLVVLLFGVSFSACKKSDPVVAGKKYSDAKGTYIAIDSARWYLIKEGSGGEVHFKASGTTNANKLTITTSGDGLLTDINIPVGTDQRFSQDVVMSFSVTARQTDNFQESAVLTAYKGSDTLKVVLPSGNLHY
jgi:hypothetical protein